MKRDGHDYKVGYGRPPAERRFKKGASGNPRGSPRGSKNIDLLLEAELSNKISVNENGRRRTITKREGMIKQMVNQALAGNDRAVRLILEHLPEIDNSETRSRDNDGRVSIHLVQAVLAQVDAYQARRKLASSGSPASDCSPSAQVGHFDAIEEERDLSSS
jgi:hypothetical protein